MLIKIKNESDTSLKLSFYTIEVNKETSDITNKHLSRLIHKMTITSDETPLRHNKR